VGTNTQVERANQSGQAIARAGSGGDGLFHGTPVIIEANRPDLQLANGDLGLALGNGPGSPATCLIVPGRAQAIPLVVLPQHRPAFAMTIHKSQGSEWADVAIDIPARAEELLTRNLLYTAVTRSSGRIMLRSSMTDLDHCLMATSTEGRPA
jgi:exodeoxyribonuclease V alpha subunit